MRARVLYGLIGGLVASGLLGSGCGNKEPASPASGGGGATEPTSAPSASTEPAVSAASTEPPRPRKPFEVYSHCQEVVTVVFAEDPKAANAGQRTIAPSSAIEGARNPDGNQVVWLLDNKNEPIAHVRVSRGMKKVEVGKSCRTLNSY